VVERLHDMRRSGGVVVESEVSRRGSLASDRLIPIPEFVEVSLGRFSNHSIHFHTDSISHQTSEKIQASAVCVLRGY
jgi:hypothetical protein